MSYNIRSLKKVRKFREAGIIHTGLSLPPSKVIASTSAATDRDSSVPRVTVTPLTLALDTSAIVSVSFSSPAVALATFGVGAHTTHVLAVTSVFATLYWP